MPIYMNYNSIAGDVTADGHVGWVEVNSFQWGVGRGISSPTGASADRESSAPSVSEIVVTKAMDKSTPKFLNEAYQGEGQTVTVDFCKTNQGNLEVYLQYTLSECMISGYSVSSGGDNPSESLSLNFTKIETKYTPMKSKNETGDPDSITYDLGLAKVV